MAITVEKCLILLFIGLLFISSSFSLQYVKHTVLKHNGEEDPGEPLILTPYIEKGQIEEARTLSQVKGIGTYPSYSGYFTVNEQYDSNMFFWFFPAQNGSKDAPVLLWLQGGPGAASMFGLFVENGPLAVDSSFKVYERKFSWNRDYHVVYIDNPVGTGFSFTNSKNGLLVNEEQVAHNLYSCLIQFFTVFSDYQSNPFYLTGESYAGKYIPAIGYKIHTSNPDAKLKINMVGLAIGDALIDPEHILWASGYADLIYNFGLADKKEADHIKTANSKAIQYIQNKQFKEAFEIFDYLLNGDIYPYPTYFYNITGTNSYLNYLINEAPPEFGYYTNFLNFTSTRQAIHVGDRQFSDGALDVEKAMINDIMDSEAHHFVALLEENYKVLLYNGQLDIIVGAPLTENFLQQLEWSGQSEYLNAKKTVWKYNGYPAGYVRQIGKFQQVVIRNAGHILPYDQPEVAFAMIKNFINMQ